MNLGNSRCVGLLLAVLNIFALSASGQYCVQDCGLPVPGYGLYSLVFDPRTQSEARLDLYSAAYDNIYNFTIEARIFLTELERAKWVPRPILFKGQFNLQSTNGIENNGLTFSQEFLLSVTSSGTLRFTMGGDLDYGFDVESDEVLDMGRWMQVAATVDYHTSTATLFIDGEAVQRGVWQLSTPGPYRISFDDGATLSPRRPFGRIAVGWYNPIFSASSQRFNGRIDDIRIWDRALSQREISLRASSALAGNEPNLLSYHPLNEGQGELTLSPWPSSGPGVIYSSAGPVEGRLTYQPSNKVNKFWNPSEIVLNHPPTPMGITNQLATDPKDIQLYGMIDSSDSIKFLRYRIVEFPAHGKLYHNGLELGPGDFILKLGSSNQWPVIQYVRDDFHVGDDYFVYASINSRDEETPEEGYVTVPMVDQCFTIDSCGICNGDGSLCGCDNVAFSGLLYDDCGDCNGHNIRCSGCDGIPYSGLGYDGCGVCGGHNETCGGCDGLAYSGVEYDACGVCGGFNETCKGCDDVPNSGKEVDACGECGGYNETCQGCDGVPNSGFEYDDCGVCGGRNETCTGCDGIPNSGKKYDVCGVCDGGDEESSVAMDRCGVCFGDDSCVGCDGVAFSGATIDACGACSMPWEANRTCMGCDGVPRSGKQYDKCGVCGGHNNCSSGCDNQPGSNKMWDVCGVCGGDDSTCMGCDGIPQRNASLRTIFDECGVCGGNGSTCADCDGVPNGPNPPGPCGCTDSLDCLDCTGCPFGHAEYDACGVCEGNNGTCLGCDGVPNSGLVYDHCGVCGGNDSTCSSEWCDSTVPFSQFDSCNQCNGDNSTCQCVAYKNYTLVQMDCILLDYTLANSLIYIDRLISTLNDTLDEITRAELGEFNDIIGGEIRQLNEFTDICVDQLCKELGHLIKKLLPDV